MLVTTKEGNVMKFKYHVCLNGVYNVVEVAENDEFIKFAKMTSTPFTTIFTDNDCSELIITINELSSAVHVTITMMRRGSAFIFCEKFFIENLSLASGVEILDYDFEKHVSEVITQYVQRAIDVFNS